MSQMPNADTRYSSFAGMGTYANQDAVNAAKGFAVNLIQPVAPAALRGDQLRSIQGQDAAVPRRSYDARMSAAQSIVDRQIGMQFPSVPITPMQQQYLTAMGLPTPAGGNVSWLQALQIEAERRVGDVGWGSTLQASPPATVQREIAIELALTNYLLFQNLKIGLQQQAISAAHFAAAVQHDFLPTSQMPTPSMAAN